jgi:hypothetical protein
LLVMAIRTLVFSRRTAEAACGLSTSTPVSSTKVVVTMKKMSRMKTMSIMADMSMPASDPPSSPLSRKRPMLIVPQAALRRVDFLY